MTSLLATIVVLTLLAAVSPVIFLNATTIRATLGPGAAWRFVAGNVAVLVLVGSAGAGILGVGLAALIARELASRVVSGVLAVLLLGYGAYLAGHALRHRPDPSADGVEPPLAPPRRGTLGWGALGMATNYTTLPLFLAVSQRIGAATEGIGVRIALLTAVVATTAAPAWLPVLLARLPRLTRVRSGPTPASGRRRSVGEAISVSACVLGGTVLLVHSLSGSV